MLMCNGVFFKSTFEAIFLGEFLAGCRFFKISVAQPVCPWPATRRWPPWKTQELSQNMYTFNQIQSDWINAFKALVKEIVYFSISSVEIVTSESNNYQHVKSDKLSIVLVLYLLLCIKFFLCIYFWHQFRCYIYSYNDRMLLQIYVTPTTLLTVEIIHCNFMVFFNLPWPWGIPNFMNISSFWVFQPDRNAISKTSDVSTVGSTYSVGQGSSLWQLFWLVNILGVYHYWEAPKNMIWGRTQFSFQLFLVCSGLNLDKQSNPLTL